MPPVPRLPDGSIDVRAYVAQLDHAANHRLPLAIAEPPVLVAETESACCTDGHVAVALFTSRTLAEQFLDQYRQAVQNARDAGHTGVYRENDFTVLDLPVNPTSWRAFVPAHSYLDPYLPDQR